MLNLSLLAASLLPLAALAKQAHHERQASVYLFPSTSTASSSQPAAAVSSVVPADANALISAFLSIEEYEMLREGLEVPDQLTFGAEHASAPSEAPLLILADKLGREGSIEDYVSQGTLEARPHHRLQVSRTPETATWRALMHRYTERLGEKFGLTHAVKAKVSTEEHDHVKRYLLAPGSLNGEVAFDASMQDEAFARYFQSLAELASIETQGTTQVRLTGLSDIAHKFGRESSELRDAKEMMRLSVDSVVTSHSGKVAFVLAPPSHRPSQKGHKHLRGSSSLDIFSTFPRGHRHARRQDGSDLTFASEGVSFLVPTTSQCFASAEACTEGTNACSGHGTCVAGKRAGIKGKAGSNDSSTECFVCRCGVTKEGDAGRPQYWSGEFCQKKDVSSQFFLIVGSTVTLILIAVAAIGLLSSVGAEPLPSTLGALGGSQGGHAKRD